MAQAYLQLVLLEFLCQINVMLMKTYVNFEKLDNFAERVFPVWHVRNLFKDFGSLHVSRKMPTYPSPKPAVTLTSHLGQNVGLGEE